MSKTVLDAQQLAQQFFEDEVLEFEIYMINNLEPGNENNRNEIAKNIQGYLIYLHDDFESLDYSEIQTDIDKYIDTQSLESRSAYFKILQIRFADAKIASLEAMENICFNRKPFKYSLSNQDLEQDIAEFKKSNTIDRLLSKSLLKKNTSKKNLKEILEIASKIKNEYTERGDKIQKQQLAFEVHKKINAGTYNNETVKKANLSEETISRNYLYDWKNL